MGRRVQRRLVVRAPDARPRRTYQVLVPAALRRRVPGPCRLRGDTGCLEARGPVAVRTRYGAVLRVSGCPGRTGVRHMFGIGVPLLRTTGDLSLVVPDRPGLT